MSTDSDARPTEREASVLQECADWLGAHVLQDIDRGLRRTLEEGYRLCQTDHERLFLLGWVTTIDYARRTGIFTHGGEDVRWSIKNCVNPEVVGEEFIAFERKQVADFLEVGIAPWSGVRLDWVVPSYELEGKRVSFLLMRFDYDVADPRDPDRRGMPSSRAKEVLRQRPPVVVEFGSEPGARQHDRQLQAVGIRVARFSGPEIWNEPMKCAAEVEAMFPNDSLTWHRPLPKPVTRGKET